jgi:phenylalanyl-tRNA synthetase beta chain
MYLMKRKEWQVDPLNTYPGSERDWTLTLKDEVPIAKVLSVIQMISSHLLEQVILLDLYKNEQLGKDRKNATFRFIYRDKQKTLSLETIEREHAKMTQEVAEKLRDCLI